MGMQYEDLRRDNSERFIDNERPPDVPEAGVNAPKVYGNGKKKYKADDFVKQQSKHKGTLSEHLLSTKKKTNTISIGSKVKIRFPNGNEDIYIIVESNEANIDRKQISYKSPLGAALIGKKAGSNIKINAPSGVLNYKIIKIF